MTHYAAANHNTGVSPVNNSTFPLVYIWSQLRRSWTRMSISFKLSVVQSKYQRLEKIVKVLSWKSVFIKISRVFHLALSMLEWNHTIYKCLCICEWSSISILSENNSSQTISWYKNIFFMIMGNSCCNVGESGNGCEYFHLEYLWGIRKKSYCSFKGQLKLIHTTLWRRKCSYTNFVTHRL